MSNVATPADQIFGNDIIVEKIMDGLSVVDKARTRRVSKKFMKAGNVSLRKETKMVIISPKDILQDASEDYVKIVIKAERLPLLSTLFTKCPNVTDVTFRMPSRIDYQNIEEIRQVLFAMFDMLRIEKFYATCGTYWEWKLNSIHLRDLELPEIWLSQLDLTSLFARSQIRRLTFHHNNDLTTLPEGLEYLRLTPDMKMDKLVDLAESSASRTIQCIDNDIEVDLLQAVYLPSRNPTFPNLRKVGIRVVFRRDQYAVGYEDLVTFLARNNMPQLQHLDMTFDCATNKIESQQLVLLLDHLNSHGVSMHVNKVKIIGSSKITPDILPIFDSCTSLEQLVIHTPDWHYER